ncbi:ribonuclease T2-like protein [Gloeopeniophorella convolvens]|nr:ribonuclease T2-like protein [Gloeopeniophorella convolvens]
MFALVAVLASVAVTVVSGQGLASTEFTHLFSKRLTTSCGTSGQTSCHNTTKQTNLCCFESPGGLLLQTQFWDTNPSTGPSNSWTIHGLWPDKCDQTFSENCDSSRDYTNIDDLLTSQGASDTLSFMQEFWVDINGQNEQFWEHEWSTHGTCYSTLETSCLPSGSPKGAEAVAFFQRVVALFKTLPTYDWLESQGITPSSSKTYTLSQLTSALKKASGFTPQLSCSGSSINEISWYFNLKGSVIDGEFVPIDSPESSSCSSSGLKYPPKTGTPTSSGGGSPTSSSSGSSPTGPAGSLPTKATVSAITGSGSVGGLLSGGTWSTQTPGTYTISGSSSSFTLKSSKGSCGVSGGQFSCGNGASSSFSAVSSGGNTLIAYQGSTAFSSSSTPSGNTQETVFTGSGQNQHFTLALVAN